MEITVNGDLREVEAGATLSKLISSLGFDSQRIVVELNRSVVQRQQFDVAVLNTGDVVELIEFVAGG